jgi:hypothetical protein
MELPIFHTYINFFRCHFCCFTVAPLFVWDKSTAWNRCLKHPCFKNLCKIAQAFKSSDSNAQHFLLDLLTHSWFHSMLFALPGYQFPYTVMNRCFYLICAQDHHAQSSLLGNSCGAPTHASKGRFTPRGRANSLCKRLEILTCDWSKGSNRFQPLYTYMPGRFGGMNYFIKNVMTWPELVELGAPKMEGQFLA